MADYSRHHFVPQFYLRRFSIQNKLRCIGLFNWHHKLYVPCASIRDQAQRHKLYGGDDRERALGTLESMAAGAIGRIIQTKRTPARFSEDHQLLLGFILFQISRTPKAADEFNESIDKFIKLIYRRHKEFAPHIDSVRFGLNGAVMEVMSNAIRSLPITIDLQYQVLFNHTATPFITSDHPVVLYNQFLEKRKVAGSNTGLVTKGLQIFFPLSPEICLLFYDGNVYRIGSPTSLTSIIEVSKSDVHELNFLQASNSYQQIFFNDSVDEPEIRAIVEHASVHRKSHLSDVSVSPGRMQSNGLQSEIITTSKIDLRLQLELSSIKILPRAASYDVGKQMFHPRDQDLVNIHFEFLRLVDEKAYGAFEFDKFINDRYRASGDMISKLRAAGEEIFRFGNG